MGIDQWMINPSIYINVKICIGLLLSKPFLMYDIIEIEKAL